MRRTLLFLLLSLMATMAVNAQAILMGDTNGDDQLTIADVTTAEALNPALRWTSSDESVATDSHEYVDLGLPSGTLWATCNIGASSPEDYGDYFAWGETTGRNSGKTNFAWSNYKYCNGSYNNLTKYCTLSSCGTVDNLTELELSDDAAYVNWGSNWRMPSYDQITELINSNYTTTTWTTQNGVYGRRITSKSNGNSLFLPAAGYRYDTLINVAGSGGFYWSRTLDTGFPENARDLYFLPANVYTSANYRCRGWSVRPVRASQISVP